MKSFWPHALFCGLLLVQVRASETGIDFFEKRIRPVLVEHCYDCHSAQSEKLKGGLLLDTREGVARGGESGPVLVPGDAEASPLIKAVRWADEKLQMPPKKKLSAAVIADLEAWVKMGAPDPRGSNTSVVNNSKAKDHWAFQKPKHHLVPPIKNQERAQTEIDRFILEKL